MAVCFWCPPLMEKLLFAVLIFNIIIIASFHLLSKEKPDKQEQNLIIAGIAALIIFWLVLVFVW